MKRIGILSTKGGSGKTTLTTHLAAFAESQGNVTGIVDTDPQGSSALWFRIREHETPRLVQLKPDEVGGFTPSGTDYIFIDSAPAHGDDVETIAKVCDLVIIPTRPQLFDLDGIRTAVQLVAASGAKAAILLNGCPPNRGFIENSVTLDAKYTLKNAPIQTMPVTVTQRAALGHAVVSGSAVHEFEPDGKATQEVKAVWKWIEKEIS